MSELLPEQTGDETGHGWGDREQDIRGDDVAADFDGELATGARESECYEAERPPHHDRG
jgi:hypothetical protein